MTPRWPDMGYAPSDPRPPIDLRPPVPSEAAQQHSSENADGEK